MYKFIVLFLRKKLTLSHEETSKKFNAVGLKFTDEIVSFGGDCSSNSLVGRLASPSGAMDIFVFYCCGGEMLILHENEFFFIVVLCTHYTLHEKLRYSWPLSCMRAGVLLRGQCYLKRRRPLAEAEVDNIMRLFTVGSKRRYQPLGTPVRRLIYTIKKTTLT